MGWCDKLLCPISSYETFKHLGILQHPKTPLGDINEVSQLQAICKILLLNKKYRASRKLFPPEKERKKLNNNINAIIYGKVIIKLCISLSITQKGSGNAGLRFEPFKSPMCPHCAIHPCSMYWTK